MFYCSRYVTRQAGQGDGHGHVRQAAPGFPPNSFTGEPHVEGDSRREKWSMGVRELEELNVGDHEPEVLEKIQTVPEQAIHCPPSAEQCC